MAYGYFTILSDLLQQQIGNKEATAGEEELYAIIAYAADNWHIEMIAAEIVPESEEVMQHHEGNRDKPKPIETSEVCFFIHQYLFDYTSCK